MGWRQLLAVAAAGLAVGTPLWAWTHYVVTVVHEAGHAVVARACGATSVRVRVHAGSGGATEWDADQGEGALALASGFPAPAAAGLGALAGLHYGSPAWVLWGALGVLGLVLVAVRNLFGGLVVLSLAVPVYAALRLSPEGAQAWACLAGAWVLLLGSMRSAIQDGLGEGSDCELLVEEAGGHAAGWYALFVVAACGAVGWACCLCAAWW